MRASRLSHTAGRHRGARRLRRLGACFVLAAVLLLVMVATAYAYVPGQRLWVRTIGSSARQAAAWDVATGPNGAVCIVGWIGQSGPPAPDRALVVKYDAAGNKKWTRTYEGLGDAAAAAVVVDGKGNIYVAGSTWPAPGGGDDIFVAKYAANGTRKWVKTYGADNRFMDWSVELAVDGAGSAYVAAASAGKDGLEGIVVLEYDKDGNEVWPAPARLDPDPAKGEWLRQLQEMTIDAAGNVYVVGVARDGPAPTYPDYSALVFKVNGSDGTIAWGGPKYWRGKDGSGAAAYGIAVRGNAVVVVGEASQWVTGANLCVLRYDLAGTQKSVFAYNGGAASDDWAGDVAIDRYGNAYVTGGFLALPLENRCRCTVAKVSPSGTKKWLRTYVPTSRYAYGSGIRVDGSGNAYVAGIVSLDPVRGKYLTMKYSPAGVRKWAKTWTATGAQGNEIVGPALGTTGGVYVAGHSAPSGRYLQSVLIKYRR